MINTTAYFPEIRELMTTYPKSAQLLKTWIVERLKSWQTYVAFQHTGESTIPEITEEVATASTHTFIETNPRLLCDFFDQQEIHVIIDFLWDNQNKLDWFFAINGESFQNTYYPDRILTEKVAFTKAFSMLDKKDNI